MTREQAINRFLGHISNGFLRRVAREADTNADAASSLKMHVPAGGYHGPDGWWSTLGVNVKGRGIAYGTPDTSYDEPTGLITWRELAKHARTDAEQLTLEVPA